MVFLILHNKFPSIVVVCIAFSSSTASCVCLRLQTKNGEKKNHRISVVLTEQSVELPSLDKGETRRRQYGRERRETDCNFFLLLT